MGVLQKQNVSNSALPLLSLNHVSYLCKSVTESAKFYQEVLGFVLIKRPSSLKFEGAWLFNYGIGIHLLHCNSINDVQQMPVKINPKDNHISFQCTDIELVKKRLREMGMKYETALVEEGGVFVDQLFFHDPDGYMIEICNCDNIPIVPLSASACPILNKPRSYVAAKKSKALNAVEMETRMMESLFANMIDIAM
ncbi:hypothetical protein C5167_010244 [Papaver somniferum]|uniref:VOC domain-containing protein n=1 Tax=Papaver somniferum TaxID=3469 RepID=A0A4Y7JZP6_PAPSO|nr:uncharacterized protein LOC113286016 [Papaver somniferum]RZC66553.1 hypothetical protein C5167_010244 [Papaver somniferum]